MDNKPKESKGIFDDDTPPMVSKPLTEEEIRKKSIKNSLIGLVLGLVPVVLVLYTKIKYGWVTTDENNDVISATYMVYGLTVATPLAIAAMIFSVIGISNEKNALSIIATIVAFLPAALVVFLIISEAIMGMF